MSFSRARRDTQRRRTFAIVLCSGLALASCGLDLKGELAAEIDESDGAAPPVGGDGAQPPDDSAVDATNLHDASGATADAGVLDVAILSAQDAQAQDESRDYPNGTDAPSDSSSSAGDATGASNDGSTCNFAGTWGAKITAAVNWVPQGVTSFFIAPGQGTIQQWIKTTRVVTGTTTTETGFVCGITLPDFSGTNFVGGETYGVRFPSGLFDRTAPDGGWFSPIPSFAISGTLSDSTPNATYTTTDSAVLIGLTLSNPSTAQWPGVVTTAVDTDGDGNPGITIDVADGGIYSPVPVDVNKTRANELYVAIRQVSSLSGAASDCDHMTGTASIPKIPGTSTGSTGKYAIDSHIIGCGLVDGGHCSPQQAGFADGTQPVFSPTGTTVFTSLRVANTATCANIRQLLP